MPRLLIILYKRPNEILNGGDVVSLRNVKALESVLGKDNVDVYHIHGEGTRKMSHLAGAFHFLSNHFYGLTPGRTEERRESSASG